MAVLQEVTGTASGHWPGLGTGRVQAGTWAGGNAGVFARQSYEEQCNATVQKT